MQFDQHKRIMGVSRYSAMKYSIQALEFYRNKDLVEKASGNLKEQLNLRHTAVSSSTA